MRKSKHHFKATNLPDLLDQGKNYFGVKSSEQPEGIKAGDTIDVAGLQTKVVEIRHEYGEHFAHTEYGDFNLSLCKKV